MKDPWEDYRADPLTPEELQRVRLHIAETTRKLDLLWFLWGWLATAVQDRKAWVAAAAISAFLWGERIIEGLQRVMGVGP